VDNWAKISVKMPIPTFVESAPKLRIKIPVHKIEKALFDACVFPINH
jgi:hypothetical protein